MKYKVGDKVRIKSLDWYNKNKSKRHGTVACGGKYFDYDMREWCGKIMTILTAYQTCYIMEEDGAKDSWTDEMIEGLVEESDDFKKMYMESEKRYEEEYSKGEYCHEQSFKWGFQEGYNYSHENDKLEINLKNGYQFVDENGNVINATKIVLEKKEYPKTFLECCEVLGHVTIDEVRGYKATLLDSLQMLLVCRDAYWKIAGEEMGLGKPWKPDYDSGVNKYGIICINGVIQKSNPTTNWERHLNKVLDFPTEEMRDAFKENFDPDIEICKELL